MTLKELYEVSRTRTANQIAIEEAIDRFRPDFFEASEIITAVVVALRHRYKDELGVDLEHAFKMVFDQLNEADATWERAMDEMTLGKWDRLREEEELLNGQRVNDET